VISFGNCCSTPVKAILTVTTVSLMLGFGCAVIYGISTRFAFSAPAASRDSFEEIAADSASATMPKVAWKARVEAAIAAHCVFVGMAKNDVEQAIGRPTQSNLPYWPYWREDKQNCRVFTKDVCVDYQRYEATVHFTPRGNVKEVIGAENISSKSLAFSCYSVSFPSVEAASTVNQEN